jgi:hypothetical protein
LRWFRQNVRLVGRLALFALAVHMVVSFGHVHLDDVAAASAGMGVAANTVSAAATPGPAHPAHPYQDSAAHDFCTLCANIGLLGSLILPVPSALAASREFDRIRYRYAAATGVSIQPRSSFQARAPPFA